MNQVQVQTEVKKPSSKEIINRLRAEATENKAFEAMCHVFALRERTRQQVTMHSLTVTMLKEGFSFPRPAYERALIFLASMGIGNLDYDSKGRLRALKGIKVTLQSIGLAAVSKKDSLDKYALAPTFTSLLPQAAAKAVNVEVKKPVVEAWPASLTVIIDGKPVSFDLPAMTAKDLSVFLAKTYAKKGG